MVKNKWYYFSEIIIILLNIIDINFVSFAGSIIDLAGFKMHKMCECLTVTDVSLIVTPVQFNNGRIGGP